MRLRWLITDEESREHFAGLCKLLEAAGIAYTVNQRLVRGLDYYNRTVFEWVTTSLAQGTVCAGGRYDGLVEQLGGRAAPAVGFAMGLERLVLLVQAVNPEFKADSVVDIHGGLRRGNAVCGNAACRTRARCAAGR